jgi:ABC-2 type transport system permease protein
MAAVGLSGVSVPAYRQLALVNFRELVRDRPTLIFTTIFPLAFLLMFAFIPSNKPVGAVNVAIVQQPGAHVGGAVKRAFAGTSFRALRPGSVAGADAELAHKAADVVVVAERDGSLLVRGRSDQGTAVYLVREALLQATRAPGSPSVVVAGSRGTSIFDGRSFGIPAVLILALTSLALLGTATPIILLRQRKTLRLIGLTPCTRLTFVLAQVPARLGIGLFHLLVVCVIGTAWGVLHVQHPGALAGVVVLGLAMLFSLGYFAGGVIRSPELGSGLLAGLMPVVLMGSGVLLPLQLMPHALTTMAKFSPFGHFGSLLRHELVGTQYVYDPTTSVLVMLGFTVAVTMATLLTFRWDEGESR